MTKKQIEKITQILLAIGLASLAFGARNFVVGEGSTWANLAALLTGVLELVLCVWLTKYVDGDKV